jgi:hypothetical protein
MSGKSRSRSFEPPSWVQKNGRDGGRAQSSSTTNLLGMLTAISQRKYGERLWPCSAAGKGHGPLAR